VDHPDAEAADIACNGVERREKAAKAKAVLSVFIVLFSTFLRNPIRVQHISGNHR
jgi:hypothetical protein